ncbi:MAG: DNA/RNA non-specific endonuclease [Muribaculaceae bacterium]|nr:DNA/RNA non-specific endonuclease [Muribaculaceae bacterium]
MAHQKRNTAKKRGYKRRLLPTDRRTLAILLVLVLLCGCIWAYRRYQKGIPAMSPKADASVLTNVIAPAGTPSVLLDYEGFTVSYNPQHRIPNYVSWELTAAEAASRAADRKNVSFAADADVEGCPVPGDYRKSGFDRGHMAPAGDMRWSDKAMEQCHYMTNIAPQVNSLNTGSWKKLEEATRRWAAADSAVIVVCGPVLTDRLSRKIGASEVTVPERFFKVIMAPYAQPPRAIGFIFHNNNMPQSMQQAVRTVDQVEEITGLDFFSALPDEIENQIESTSSLTAWH